MTTPIGFAIFNGMWPLHTDAEHGPRSLYYPVDLTTVAEGEINLGEAAVMAQLKWIQGVYIDNADNSAVFTLTAQISQQRIIAKENTQGFYPLFAPDLAKFNYVSAIDSTIVRLHFVNVPLPWGQWSVI